MYDEDRFASVPAQLDGLLEDGEISPEAFAPYRTMGARVVAAYREAREAALRAATIGATHEECADAGQ